MIKFSICIPAYKSKFFKCCIESILNQTYTSFELIILNDASPEPIEEICFNFNDPRIKYYKNDKNIGAENLVDNWNKCLELSSGEFIMIMGDDDTLEPSYLDEFLKLIQKYPRLNVFHCRSRIIDENNNTIGFTQSWAEYESVYDYMWQKFQFIRNQYISDFVYRRKFLVDNGGFFKLPLAWGSDVITSFIAAKEKGIAHTNSLIFNYRGNSLTISSSTNTDAKLLAVDQMKDFLNKFLISSPIDGSDKILHSFIKKESLERFILRNRKSIINKHIKAYRIKGLFDLIIKNKRFNISLKEIIKTSI